MSMRNSDPRVRIVIENQFQFPLHIYLATGCDFQHGSNSGPRIQPFGSDDFTSRCTENSRHVTCSANCKNSSVSFVMKYSPTPTVVRNPASIQIFINRSGCGSLSTRSWCFCNKFSCARISIEGLGVIISKFAGANNGSVCLANAGLTVLTWQALYSSHKSETATQILS